MAVKKKRPRLFFFFVFSSVKRNQSKMKTRNLMTGSGGCIVLLLPAIVATALTAPVACQSRAPAAVGNVTRLSAHCVFDSRTLFPLIATKLILFNFYYPWYPEWLWLFRLFLFYWLSLVLLSFRYQLITNRRREWVLITEALYWISIRESRRKQQIGSQSARNRLMKTEPFFCIGQRVPNLPKQAGQWNTFLIEAL